MVFLGDLVLPRLAIENKGCFELAMRMVSEMEELKIPIFHALPGLVRFTNEIERTSERLLEGLKAVDRGKAASAIHGIYLWAVHSERGAFPGIPERLVLAIVTRILALRRPSLGAAMARMSQLIQEAPNLITQAHLDLLGVALEYLLAQTELPAQSRQLAQVQSELSVLPLPKRPRYRQLAARLAFTLFRFAKEQKFPVPKSIDLWNAVCQVDPLPEVRMEWQKS